MTDTAKKTENVVKAEWSKQATEADALLKNLPEEVKNAVESMRRTIRFRRAFTEEDRAIHYEQVC